MEVRYLNTDLELESEIDLTQIVEEFGADVIVLYHGKVRGYHHASFEIAGSTASVNETIEYFCSLVEALPDTARKVWDGCCARVFDIGYESGTRSRNLRSEIASTTLQRVAGIGASIIITIYPLSAAAESNVTDAT